MMISYLTKREENEAAWCTRTERSCRADGAEARRGALPTGPSLPALGSVGEVS